MKTLLLSLIVLFVCIWPVRPAAGADIAVASELNQASRAAPAQNAPAPDAVSPAGAATLPASPSLASPDPSVSRSPLPASERLRDEGMKHFEARRFEPALEKLSLFASLYPADDKTPSVMITIGRILTEMQRPIAAIRLYSHILDRYSGTAEAIETIMALADLGLLMPNLRPPLPLSGTRYYLQPVDAYDMALSQNPSPSQVETLILKRIAALRLQGRYRDAYAAGGRFMEQNPETLHKQTILTGLRADLRRLIEERFAAGDDIAVINLMVNGRRRGLISMTETEIMIQVAKSYARANMAEEARTLLNRARYFAAADAVLIDATLQELEQAKPLPEVLSSVIERWELYDRGRREIEASELAAAEKTFAQLKGMGEDEFWSKLTDFALKDGVWRSKYKNYLRK